MNIATLNQILDSEALEAIDRQFARFAMRLNGGQNPELLLAAALTSFHANQGSICISLPDVAETDFPQPGPGEEKFVRCPAFPIWQKKLRASSVVGHPGEFKPLILDEAGRLYLHRYWKYENDLARVILERATASMPHVDWDLAREGFARLFSKSQGIDWQKVAAFAALRKNLCIISGGPGTGKTHTVAKILALLIEQSRGKPLRIKLAAPTGKAAARLQESLQREKAMLNCAPEVKAQLPEEATTIHRLLGTIPDSATFRHNAENLLAVDILIVDEASMVGLPLMAKLVTALPKSARLILLGDKDQLASVEAGAVLGDICNAGSMHEISSAVASEYEALTGEKIKGTRQPPAPALIDCIVELRRNYRFSEKSIIHQLSNAVNEGMADKAIGALGDYSLASGEVSWRPLPDTAGLKAALKPIVLNHLSPCFKTADPKTVLGALERFRILCAVRKGHHGASAINQLVEEILREAGYIHTDSAWYAGRPVMITRNDYNLRLFNGDVGIVLPDVSGSLRVFFATEEDGIRSILPLRLPEHETVYAMTVHKSQGSEFENVLLILPERDSPVLTRELVYTGLTRARDSVQLWFREEIFKTAIGRKMRRASGLRDALWQPAGK